MTAGVLARQILTYLLYAAAYVGGVLLTLYVFVLTNGQGFDARTDELIPYVVLFQVLFGMVVARWVVLVFPAVHWLGYEWLRYELRPGPAFFADGHPVEVWLIASVATIGGVIMGRAVRRAWYQGSD